MYTYDNLCDDIGYLAYNGAETGSIGNSLYGNEIFYIHTGSKSGRQIIITGGIHARENVTAITVIYQAYRMLGESAGIYFLPMLNPDGALLCEKGAVVAGEYASFVTRINGGDDFSLWKANGRGVDLNVNFDAKFGRGKNNILYPAPQNCVGSSPFSEPETRALRDFTLAVRPAFTVSYHALGGEVYWYFGQRDNRDRRMAWDIAKYLGYKAVDGDLASAGGYKDWCVLQGIPAVTIEMGSGNLTHPVTEEQVGEDIMRNLDLPKRIVNLLKEIY